MAKNSVTSTQHTPTNNEQSAGNSAQSVKALVRGLNVLVAMNDMSPVTVTRLVQETGYPKATVIRLLQTLCHQGYVEEVENGRGYQVCQKVMSLSRALAAKHSYQKAAEQLLKDLGVALKWPANLLIRDGYSMALEVSNRASAPIKLQTFERRRFPLLESAAGIAYLGALPAEEAKALATEIIGATGLDRSRAAPRRKSIQAMFDAIAAANTDGYALRSYDLLSLGMRVAAIPLFADGKPIGSVSLVHYEQYVPDSVLERIILPALRQVADAISENLHTQ